MWMIFYKVCEQIGEPHRSKYTAMVIAAIVIICGTTGQLFPFKLFAVIQIGLTTKAIGAVDINFVSWFAYNVVISILLSLGYVLACKLVLRPDLSRVKEAGAKYAHLRGRKDEQRNQNWCCCFSSVHCWFNVAKSFA